MIICKPGDPKAKGLVERFNGYLESSFHAGHTSDSLADFNVQLSKWLATNAVSRQRRAPGCRPADRFEVNKAAMVTLPPVMPALGWHASTRLPRDHYVRIGSNKYSVDPVAIG